MTPFKTEQESFWAGGFGDEYAARNRGSTRIAANLALFANVLARTAQVKSVLELGANIGLNLQALGQLLPDANLTAVEINGLAVEELKKIRGIEVIHQSILDFKSSTKYDFVLCKGVLIHIDPASLESLYRTVVASSNRYICLVEYYSPAPVAIEYRGHTNKLFKRDFAGEMLKTFPELRLLDYGFVYRGDPNFAQDDVTWFLLEKGSQPL